MRNVLISVLAIMVLTTWGMMRYEQSIPAHPPIELDTSPSTIKKGEYLAKIGDCKACHTAPGQPAFSGNRPLSTPFGTIYAPNITPDIKTGIGTWTADDFWNALHHGISKQGTFLYPAFPFPNYTTITRTDANAIWAYLKTVKPMQQEKLENNLQFPYNYRPLLAFWRFIYFKPGSFENQPQQSSQWNRGAYLVKGLGHCNACHTERNALGATILQADLTGSLMTSMNWYAPSLTSSHKNGLGGWSDQDIREFLKTGIASRGTVFGPMAEVVSESLQYLSDDDAQAMAIYLKSVPGQDVAASLREPEVPFSAREKVLAHGKTIYTKYCIDCHGAQGKGMPPHYPPLAQNHAITMYSAVNPIRLVLHGGFAPSTAGNPRPYGMPPFRHQLNNEEVAAVVSYIMNAWGNNQEPVSPVEVDRYRSIPE